MKMLFSCIVLTTFVFSTNLFAQSSEDLENAISKSKLPVLTDENGRPFYVPDGRTNGFDCDDYCEAAQDFLERYFETNEDVSVHFVTISWKYLYNLLETRARRDGHAMVAVKIGGSYYLIEPQNGKVYGPEDSLGDFDFQRIISDLLDAHLDDDRQLAARIGRQDVRGTLFDDRNDWFENSSERNQDHQTNETRLKFFKALKRAGVTTCPYCGGPLDEEIEELEEKIRNSNAENETSGTTIDR